MKVRHLVWALAVFAFAIFAINASAVDPGGATVVSEENLGAMPEIAPGNVTAIAGNVTRANLNANVSTYRWAAVIGNVTGNIILGDQDNYHMYTWTGTGRVVYCSESDDPDWSNLAEATEANVTDYYTHLADASDADSYSNTFGGTDTLDSGIFDSLGAGDFVDTLNSTGGAVWRTFSLYDDSNVVFASEVQEDTESYRLNETVDYQMLVPEDGSGGDTSTTTYYLWVELN